MEKAAIKEVKMKKKEANGMKEEELNGWMTSMLHNDFLIFIFVHNFFQIKFHICNIKKF